METRAFGIDYFGFGDKQEDVLELIKLNGDKRIPQSTVDFYKNPDGSGVVVRAFYQGRLIGFSASALMEPGHSITVIDRDFRGWGIGSSLLAKKLRLCRTKAYVAEDNAGSIRICERVGMVVTGRRLGRRQSGDFTQVVYEFKSKKGIMAWLEKLLPTG